MAGPDDVTFTDNSAAAAQPDRYLTVMISVARVLESWQSSLFSYEWMMPDGRLKKAEELASADRDRRAAVELRIRTGEALEKPVLGIGLMDNIEIGAARATFLTLAALGMEKLPVHIPKSHADEFDPFLAGT